MHHACNNLHSVIRDLTFYYTSASSNHFSSFNNTNSPVCSLFGLILGHLPDSIQHNMFSKPKCFSHCFTFYSKFLSMPPFNTHQLWVVFDVTDSPRICLSLNSQWPVSCCQVPLMFSQPDFTQRC